MALGYASGKMKSFTADNARSFNKLVLNYALPAALFLSIVKSDRSLLLSDLKLTLVSFIGLVGMFMWAYWGCHKLFKHTRQEGAVCALIAGDPAVGFLGLAVLAPIFGNTTNTGLVVAIAAIITHAIMMPIGFMLLNPSIANASGKKDAGKHNSYLVNAVIQPVVWMPILAVVLVMVGIKFPTALEPTFSLIGKTSAGVAVFAAGLTLSGVSFVLNKEILYNTFVKLFLMPAVLLGLGLLFGLDSMKLQMLVMVGALPPAFSGVIVGSRYNEYVKIGTSSLAVSTFMFMVAAPLWIWSVRMVAP